MKWKLIPTLTINLYPYPEPQIKSLQGLSRLRYSPWINCRWRKCWITSHWEQTRPSIIFIDAPLKISRGNLEKTKSCNIMVKHWHSESKAVHFKRILRKLSKKLIMDKQNSQDPLICFRQVHVCVFNIQKFHTFLEERKKKIGTCKFRGFSITMLQYNPFLVTQILLF